MPEVLTGDVEIRDALSALEVEVRDVLRDLPRKPILDVARAQKAGQYLHAPQFTENQWRLMLFALCVSREFSE